MNQEAQIFDTLAAVLAEIRPRFGAAGFEDRRRVIGLLADKAPQAKREIRAIGVAIDEGVPATLMRTERHLAGVEMDRLANSLEAATGLRLDLARRVVRSFAFALDLGPPPSIYEAAGAPPIAPAPPPPPPSQTSDWSGLSTPVAPAYSQPSHPSQPIPPPYPSQPYATGPVSAPLSFASAQPKQPNMVARVAIGLGGLVVLAVGLSQMIGNGAGTGGNGISGNRQADNTVIAQGDRGFADELVDQGVQPTVELVSQVASPTPLSISVGQRITTDELQQMIQQDPDLLLVDVLASPHPQTLPRAVWLPSGGTPGSFQDSYQGDFAAGLTQATGGVTSRPLVFFCAGANCWESHNAVLRANAAGFQRLYWYRGGIASWAEARQPMEPLPGQGQAQNQDQQIDPNQGQADQGVGGGDKPQ